MPIQTAQPVEVSIIVEQSSSSTVDPSQIQEFEEKGCYSEYSFQNGYKIVLNWPCLVVYF